MLKISIKDSKTKRLLILEGKFVATWTDELKGLCNESEVGPDQRELVIDVRGVTDISTDGEQALLHLMARGARFRGTGIFMKQVLKELALRARQK